MEVNGIIFDFDGTLADSQYLWENVGSRYLLSIGKTPAANLHDIIEKMTMTQAAEYLKAEYQINDSIEGIIRGVKSFIAQEYKYNVQIKDGVSEVLKEMASLGIKMCVATTNDLDLVKATSQRCGIDKYFSAFFSGSQLNISKTTPRLYEIALEHLGTDKESTWIFEDSLYAVRSAKSAGFNVAAVYDESSKKYRSELEDRADIYLNSIKEWKMIYG